MPSAAATTDQAPDPGPPTWRTPARRVAELLGLTVLAIVAPTVADLTASDDVALALQVSRSDLAIAATIATLGIVASASAVVAIVDRWSSSAGAAVHGGALVALGGAWSLQLARHELALSGVAAVGASVLLLAVLVAIARRWRSVLLAVAVASPLTAAGALVVADLTAVGRSEAVPPALQLAVEGEPTPVVIVILDALPVGNLLDGTGAIDGSLYPSMARLADDATWYRNHVTVGLTTLEVLPALVRGTAENVGTTRSFDDVDESNLLRAMDPRYAVVAQEPVMRGICPDACVGAGAGDASSTTSSLLRIGRDLLWRRLTTTPPPTSAGAPPDPVPLDVQTTSEGAVALTRQSIDQLGPELAQIALLHVLLPHRPYTWTDDCQRYEPLDAPYGTYTTQAAADAARQGNLLQAACADRLVGELLDRLVDLELYDDALIVLVADHGDAAVLGSSPRFLSPANQHELLWTPLLVKVPGQTAPVVDDRLVRTHDIVPTILDVLGTDPTWAMDGVPAGERGEQAAAAVFAGEWVQDVDADGGWVDVDVEAGLARAISAGPWGATGDDRSLYGAGRDAGLVGQRASPSLGAPWRSGADVDGLESLGETVDGVLRLGVTGAVTVTDAAPVGARAVALVADGVIVATADLAIADPSDDVGEHRFWLRAPPAISGADVQLAIVAGDGSTTSLHLVDEG